MKLAITCKLMAEDRKELERLGGIYETTQAHFNKLHGSGLLGDPEKVEIRWLLVGGRWFPPGESTRGVEVPPEPIVVEEVPPIKDGPPLPEETYP